jgi:hypothetical protein
MKSLVQYMYRDVSNYKKFGEFIIDGTIAFSEIDQFFWEGEFFIPERIGAKSLVSNEKTDDDHYLHEIIAIQGYAEGEAIMAAADLVARFRKAANEGWFYEKLSVSERALVLAIGRRTGLANPDWQQVISIF